MNHELEIQSFSLRLTCPLLQKPLYFLTFNLKFFARYCFFL